MIILIECLMFWMSIGNEKDLSYNTHFAKNIIILYIGIMDRFNFINFMDSYNLNVNLWDTTFTGKIKFFSKI